MKTIEFHPKTAGYMSIFWIIVAASAWTFEYQLTKAKTKYDANEQYIGLVREQIAQAGRCIKKRPKRFTLSQIKDSPSITYECYEG